MRALIEKKIDKMIKYVQTNDSIEICSKLLNELYMKEGIVR